MTASGSRARVAAAAAAALLAGTAAGWLTHPSEAAPEPGGTSAAVTASALAHPTEPSPTTSPTTPPSTGPPQEPLGKTAAHTAARDARLGDAPAPALPPPARFEVESVGISMRVRPVGVATDGQMALPPSPALMGWYEYGPRPGDTEGATVLAAHRDMPDFGTGPAARLERLSRGDLLTVRSGSNVRRYRVVQVTRLEKEGLDLEAIFDRTGPARLHVVTCGGRFDPATRTYEANLVVVGVPL
ncbi:MAG TPA: class F sortase [Intrasporangium sp.]|uniref:class F sortase n=1 Tax=Intrasporangium sp. TaxID=1925024 RepID=UPI002B46C016|nr:class F sortase [Intrasporangium sp.]HKX67159.1 class F sortase [Intrasporangium sp.]